MTLSRRSFVRGAAVTAGAATFAPFLNLGRFRLFGWSAQEYSARCIDLV